MEEITFNRFLNISADMSSVTGNIHILLYDLNMNQSIFYAIKYFKKLGEGNKKNLMFLCLSHSNQDCKHRVCNCRELQHLF